LHWKRENLPDAGSELLCSIDAGDFGPGRLINADAIEDGRELVTVLGIVNHFRIGSQDVEAVLLEPEGDVLRELT
jgi:hypothetical protein